MYDDYIENNEKGKLDMNVSAKPTKIAFVVKAEKAKEFRNQSDKKKIHDIQHQAKRITNINYGNNTK